VAPERKDLGKHEWAITIQCARKGGRPVAPERKDLGKHEWAITIQCARKAPPDLVFRG